MYLDHIKDPGLRELLVSRVVWEYMVPASKVVGMNSAMIWNNLLQMLAVPL